jgi:hypothetical protein
LAGRSAAASVPATAMLITAAPQTILAVRCMAATIALPRATASHTVSAGGTGWTPASTRRPQGRGYFALKSLAKPA